MGLLPRNARGAVAGLLLLAALAATVAACGGNDDDAGAAAATAPTATTAPAAPTTTTAPADRKWKKVVPGGDCECADGSEFAFWERRADPTKVVLFLDGGGTCFDAKSCAFTGLGTGGEGNYDWSIYGEDPAQEGGIFDFARADNPFRDSSFISVPVCTGDMHLGDVTREYSPELTVEHNGFVNGTTALSYLAEHYPDAAQLVVVGKGRVGRRPVYGGLASDLLPDAQVTVLGAVSGHLPDDPDLNEFFGERWGAYANMPDWEVNEGLTARDWGAPRFWIQAGLHDPEIVLARFDFAYDAEAAEDAVLSGRTRRSSSPRSMPTRRRSRRPGLYCTATPRAATATGSSNGRRSTSFRSTVRSSSTG